MTAVTDHTVEFAYLDHHYLVRRRASDNQLVWKDKAHLGGPWSPAERTISNTSLVISFRRKLAAACAQFIATE